MPLEVALLRELFRHLQSFRALYESEGIDTIPCPDGTEICLFDLEYLYDNLKLLPRRQRQAIELCLVRNLKESDAAAQMGVALTNPVAMYASAGLQKLIQLIYAGEIPRFQWDGPVHIQATG